MKLRLRIVSYDGEFGRSYYVVNLKSDKEWEVLKTFITKNEAEKWKDQMEAANRQKQEWR